MKHFVVAVFLAWLPAAAAPAQSSEPTRAELERHLEAYRRLLLDWAGLTRYGSENTELPLPADEDRVVFLGDEITENWPAGAFSGKPYLNRGIARQTTAQMLVRFRQDVVALKPKVVVIQGGGNDIAGLMGPATLGTISENIMSMTDLARFHGIRVVLASVTPVCDCVQNLTARRSPPRIMNLNEWLQDYARKNGFVYLDYYGALAQGRFMRPELTVDGLIPNAAGYAKMAPLAEQAIAEALRRPAHAR